jgi:dihydrofolate reductase
MRRLSIVEFVTLDGVMQGFHAPDPDDPSFPYGGWGVRYADPESAERGTESQAGTTAYLLGRRTYQALAAFWPHQPADNAMATHLNTSPKYVATRTLTSLDWSNSSIIDGELSDAVRALKDSGEGTITVLGSGMLVQQLIRDGLVDGYTLFVHPLALGSGQRLFRDLDRPVPMRLDDVAKTGTGVVILTYAVESA